MEFELLDSSARVCAFYSLQNDPAKPRVVRRGKYFRDWTRANRDLPWKGQPMTPEVFLEGQVYTIEVRENRKTESEEEKEDSEIYSTVTRILTIDFPSGRVF